MLFYIYTKLHLRCRYFLSSFCSLSLSLLYPFLWLHYFEKQWLSKTFALSVLVTGKPSFGPIQGLQKGAYQMICVGVLQLPRLSAKMH